MSFTNLFTPSVAVSFATASTTAARAIDISKGGQVRVKNQDATDTIVFKFGISSDTVTLTTGIVLGPGDVAGFTMPGTTTHIITISSANTPSLNVVQGWGT